MQKLGKIKRGSGDLERHAKTIFHGGVRDEQIIVLRMKC